MLDEVGATIFIWLDLHDLVAIVGDFFDENVVFVVLKEGFFFADEFNRKGKGCFGEVGEKGVVVVFICFCKEKVATILRIAECFGGFVDTIVPRKPFWTK